MGLCVSAASGVEESPDDSSDVSVFNCVMIGSAGVGKTSLCEFMKNKREFVRTYTPSKGMDVYSLDTEPRPVRIFCNAGMARVTIGTAYYKSASCFILMYDVCDTRSFKESQSQLNSVTRHGPARRPPIFMLGNKVDEYGDPAWQSEAPWESPEAGAGPDNADLNFGHVMARTKPTERSRQVTVAEAQDFCDEHDIKFFEISAEKGTGVDEFFESLFSA